MDSVLQTIGYLLVVVGLGVLVGAFLLFLIWLVFFINLGGPKAIKNAWIKAWNEAKENSNKND